MKKHPLKSITLITLALTLNPVFTEDAAKPDDAEALAWIQDIIHALNRLITI